MSDLTRAGEFGYPGLPRYTKALYDWFFAEQHKAWENAILPDGEWRLCLGCAVWGGYVERFLRYCVPSLLAPGNVSSLFDPLIIIHTDKGSVERITAGLGALWRHARIELHVIPDDIIAMVPEMEANKYWLLGTALNLHMQQAKYRAHAYHMLMPDHVYAAGYFSNLSRRAGGHEAIVQGALSAKMEEVGPILEATGCAVSPEKLAALAIEHLHPQLEPFVMNGREDFPRSMLLIMVGEKATHIISPHISIVYLSHKLLMRMKPRIYNTTDAQLPFFIPGDVEPYMPHPDDGMAYCELSDVDKKLPWKDGISLVEFCARFWVMAYCHRDFERFFGLTTLQPYPRDFVPPIKPMTDAEIAELKANVRGSVADSFEMMNRILPEQFRGDPLTKLQAIA